MLSGMEIRSGKLLLLFFELGPAAHEFVQFGGGVLQFGLGSDQGWGVALDGGVDERGLGSGNTGFGGGDLLLDGCVFASFFVGKLFLCWRGGC